MKTIFFSKIPVLLCFALCGILWAQNFNQLNNRGKGQVICHFNKKNEAKLFLFLELDNENKNWICTELDETGRVALAPAECIILPMTHQTSPQEVSTYAAYYLSVFPKNGSSPDNLIKALLIWKDSSRSFQIRSYLLEEFKVMASINHSLAKATRSSNKAKQKKTMETIRDILERSTSLTDVFNAMLNDGDLFCLICAYSRLRKNLYEKTSYYSGNMEIKKILDTWDKAILDKYKELRDSHTSRETQFSALCPHTKDSAWKKPQPLTFEDLEKLCKLSFQGFETTRATSSFCDFPQWGNGMLDVLLTLAPASECAQFFENEFDAAIKRYSDNQHQFTK